MFPVMVVSVIRDSAGTFIAGFAKSVHHVISVYQVELFGIKEALIFLSSAGMPLLMIVILLEFCNTKSFYFSERINTNVTKKRRNKYKDFIQDTYYS
jgi:hypothetical protein